MSKKTNWILVLALVLTSFVVFGLTLKNPFYFDDHTAIEDNGGIRTVSPPFHYYHEFFINPDAGFDGFRPTLMMTYWANIRLLGNSLVSFHIGNILIHTLNAILWVFILLELCPVIMDPKIAWWSGFLFLLHPVQTIAINFLWKRSTLLEVFFTLLMVLIHIRERKRHHFYRWWLIAPIAILYLGAMTSKESGIIAIGFLILMDACFYREKIKNVFRECVFVYSPLLVCGILFYGYRFVYGEKWLLTNTNVVLSQDSQLSVTTYIIDSVGAIAKYFWIWLIPKPLVFDDPSQTQWYWMLLAALVTMSFVGSFILAVRFRKKPLISFLLGVIWVSFLPTVTHIRLRYIVDQIRLYLPIAGLSTLLVIAVFKCKKWILFRKAEYVLTALVFFYGACTIFQNIRYHEPIQIYNDVVHEYPQSSVGWDLLAVAYHDKKMYPQAQNAHVMASHYDPLNPELQFKVKMWEALYTTDPIIRDQKLLELDVSKAVPDTLFILVWDELQLNAQHALTKHIPDAKKRFPGPAVDLMLARYYEHSGRKIESLQSYTNALAADPANEEAATAVRRLKN